LEVKLIRMWELLRNTGAPIPCNGPYSPECVEGVFSEDEMRRPTLNAVPYALQTLYGLILVAQRKEDRP
jgi:hypothetical protein